MPDSEPFDDNVLLEREVLRATLAVRDQLLSSVVSDIYEHTGQLLSAIRVQLALIEQKVGDTVRADVQATGKLVSQSIMNLRAMSRSFYPEEALKTAAGFASLLTLAVNSGRTVNPPAKINIAGASDPSEVKLTALLLLFNAILDIAARIRERKSSSLTIDISFTHPAIRVDIQYTGDTISLAKAWPEALNLVEGNLKTNTLEGEIHSIVIWINDSVIL